VGAVEGWWDIQTEDATSFASVPEHLILGGFRPPDVMIVPTDFSIIYILQGNPAE